MQHTPLLFCFYILCICFYRCTKNNFRSSCHTIIAVNRLYCVSICVFSRILLCQSFCDKCIPQRCGNTYFNGVFSWLYIVSDIHFAAFHINMCIHSIHCKLCSSSVKGVYCKVSCICFFVPVFWKCKGCCVSSHTGNAVANSFNIAPAYQFGKFSGINVSLIGEVSNLCTGVIFSFFCFLTNILVAFCPAFYRKVPGIQCNVFRRFYVLAVGSSITEACCYITSILYTECYISLFIINGIIYACCLCSMYVFFPCRIQSVESNIAARKTYIDDRASVFNLIVCNRSYFSRPCIDCIWLVLAFNRN